MFEIEVFYCTFEESLICLSTKFQVNSGKVGVKKIHVASCSINPIQKPERLHRIYSSPNLLQTAHIA
jgi:hypothetical protein